MSILLVNACICSGVKLLVVKDYRGGRRQKEFNEMFSKYVKLDAEQLIGKIKRFVEEWAPEQLEVPECLEVEEDFMFKEMERDAKIFVTTKIPKTHLISGQSSWFRQCIGILHDFFIAKLTSDQKSIDKRVNAYNNEPARITVFVDGGGSEVNENWDEDLE